MKPDPTALAVVLVTHAPLGQALYACAQHVLATPPSVRVADILPTDLPEPWIDTLVNELRAQNKQHVLMLCDLYGSTPYHIATGVQRQLCLKGFHVHLLSGVNVCMLVKALTDASPTMDERIQNILHSTHRGIVHQAPTVS